MTAAIPPAVPTRNRPSEDQVLQAQVRLMVEQSRTGQRVVPLVGLILGLMFQPAAGWTLYLGWFALLLALFVVRDRLLKRVQEQEAPSKSVARTVMLSTAVIGFGISVCAPLFFPYLSGSQRGLLTGILLAWVAMAAAILGTYPACYRVYLVIFVVNVTLAWVLYGTGAEPLVAVAVCLPGASVLWRFSSRVGALIADSVNVSAENRALAEKLKLALADAERANAARARFLAAASHDLRQPVHALMLLSGLMGKPLSPERQREIAHQIGVTSETLDSMFLGLLDLARIDAGTLVARLETVPLRPLCQSLAAAYAERCAVSGIRFETECPPGLAVRADPALLGRVLGNVVNNAVKFTKHGAILVECSESGNGEAVILVRDTGVGMDPEDLAHVCEAFFRGKSAREVEADGVGLGLATASQMALLMGHRIEITSERGAGTVVRMVAPRADLPQAGSKTPGGAAPLAYSTIALIEDDRLAREGTQIWLEEHGCTVAAGADAQSVIAMLEKRNARPEFVLADYNLGPGLNGYQAIAQIRERFGPVPAAIVTGDSLQLAVPDTKIPVLIKPLKPEALEALLGRSSERT